MSQKAFIAAFDQQAHAAFKAGGLADAGSYTAPGSSVAQPVQVFMSYDVAVDGQGDQLVTPRDEMHIICVADWRPAVKARVRITADAETFELAKFLGLDGSISRWVVRRV